LSVYDSDLAVQPAAAASGIEANGEALDLDFKLPTDVRIRRKRKLGGIVTSYYRGLTLSLVYSQIPTLKSRPSSETSSRQTEFRQPTDD
jgi:hypothetical protein